MKEIIVREDRDSWSREIVSSGDFAYEMVPDFCRYPGPEWEYQTVASGFCDKDDNVYLLIRDSRHEIGVFDSEGNYIRDINSGLVSSAHFGAETPDGNIIVADPNRHVCIEMDKQGHHIRTFGTPGKASDSGMALGALMRERRHGVIITGELPRLNSLQFVGWLEAHKRITRCAEPFNQPTAITFNSEGNYIFADGYGNCAVHTFDKDGTLKSTWGEPIHDENGVRHPGPGRFFIVHDVQTDPLDRVWALDREMNAVHVFNPDGSIAAYIHGTLGSPSGAWCDGTYMYVGGCCGYISIFNMDIEPVAHLGFFNSDLRVHGLAGNSKGDLFMFATHASPDHQCFKLKRL